MNHRSTEVRREEECEIGDWELGIGNWGAIGMKGNNREGRGFAG